jgi:two-component system nitrogen regulation response regulator GlnG
VASPIIYPENPILMIDDDERVLSAQASILESSGIRNILACADPRDAVSILEAKETEVILLDLTLPHISGEELLATFSASFPQVPVIVITASDDVDTAVRCMKAGALDYMVKPVEPSRLVSGVRRAIELRTARRDYGELRERFLDGELRDPRPFSGIVTRSSKMRSIFLFIEAIAPTSQAILLYGETGTGKELLARAVHEVSGRSGPYVPMNIAGIDDTMFSDTLFGHIKGAFTGAQEQRKGLLSEAAGGTILLDEIGDLIPASQVKLLRLLETSEYYPLGTDHPRRTDARFVISTHQELSELVKAGRFRRDLYYRINAQILKIPPLRDRKQDIPLLLDHFISDACNQLGRKKISYPPQLIPLLRAYHFPGNVRELRSMIFAAVGRHNSGILSMDTFREIIGEEIKESSDIESDGPNRDFAFGPVLPTIRRITDALIVEALRRSEGNLTTAANFLGISRQALSKRIGRKDEPG